MTIYKIFSNHPDMVVRDNVTVIPIGAQFTGRFDNPDFQKYQIWLDAGNEPEYIAVVETPEVPQIALPFRVATLEQTVIDLENRLKKANI
jgi:hypothetical protein